MNNKPANDVDNAAPGQSSKLFGDEYTGPRKRATDFIAPNTPAATNTTTAPATNTRSGVAGVGRALRLGRGDGLATALNALGIMVFVSTIVASALIFNNARDVGAFSNPWNSNRVAIGFAVLALGIVHSALLVGVARGLTYQLADLRLRLRSTEQASSDTSAKSA